MLLHELRHPQLPLSLLHARGQGRAQQPAIRALSEVGPVDGEREGERVGYGRRALLGPRYHRLDVHSDERLWGLWLDEDDECLCGDLITRRKKGPCANATDHQ